MPIGAQLSFSHFPQAQAGELARVLCPETCSHFPDNWRTVRLRPDWKNAPFYVANPELIPWEWDCPEPTFDLYPGELVFVIGLVRVDVESPPNYEHVKDWQWTLACIQRMGDQKIGWANYATLEVPWLM